MVTMATRLPKGELDLTDTTIGPSIIREIKKNPNFVVAAQPVFPSGPLLGFHKLTRSTNLEMIHLL
jgi:hypothetical protein